MPDVALFWVPMSLFIVRISSVTRVKPSMSLGQRRALVLKNSAIPLAMYVMALLMTRTVRDAVVLLLLLATLGGTYFLLPPRL